MVMILPLLIPLTQIFKMVYKLLINKAINENINWETMSINIAKKICYLYYYVDYWMMSQMSH